MVPDIDDDVPPGRGAGHAHGGGIGLRSRLEEPHHLGARDEVPEPLGDLHLEGMRQREDAAALELAGHRLGHGRVGVAEGDGGQAQDVVHVLVAVHVPDAAALPPVEEDGVGALHEHAGSLAERLGGAGDHPPGAVEPAHGAVEATGRRRHGPFPVEAVRSASRERSSPSSRRIPAFTIDSSGRRSRSSRTSAMPKTRLPSGASAS